jgi:hypothetical protein
MVHAEVLRSPVKIYDNRTPEGRKVERPGTVICAKCSGREGRHVLISEKESRRDATGRKCTRNVTKECPNGAST